MNLNEKQAKDLHDTKTDFAIKIIKYDNKFLYILQILTSKQLYEIMKQQLEKFQWMLGTFRQYLDGTEALSILVVNTMVGLCLSKRYVIRLHNAEV